MNDTSKLPCKIEIICSQQNFLLPGQITMLSFAKDEIQNVLKVLQDNSTGLIGLSLNKGNQSFNVGCLARIVDVHTYEQELKVFVRGICRFEICDIMTAQPLADMLYFADTSVCYDKYKDDLILRDATYDNKSLHAALQKYNSKFDTQALSYSSRAYLIFFLSMSKAVKSLERQKIIESTTINEQYEFLISVFENFSLYSSQLIH